jgi:hypothetical protein
MPIDDAAMARFNIRWVSKRVSRKVCDYGVCKEWSSGYGRYG